jgi:hypothetical protein
MLTGALPLMSGAIRRTKVYIGSKLKAQKQGTHVARWLWLRIPRPGGHAGHGLRHQPDRTVKNAAKETGQHSALRAFAVVNALAFLINRLELLAVADA